MWACKWKYSHTAHTCSKVKKCKQKIMTGLGQSVTFLSSEVASLKNTLILLSDKPLWKPPWIMDLSWNRQNWLKLMFDSETNIPARKELIFLTQSKKTENGTTVAFPLNEIGTNVKCTNLFWKMSKKTNNVHFIFDPCVKYISLWHQPTWYYFLTPVLFPTQILRRAWIAAAQKAGDFKMFWEFCFYF